MARQKGAAMQQWNFSYDRQDKPVGPPAEASPLPSRSPSPTDAEVSTEPAFLPSFAVPSDLVLVNNANCFLPAVKVISLICLLRFMLPVPAASISQAAPYYGAHGSVRPNARWSG